MRRRESSDLSGLYRALARLGNGKSRLGRAWALATVFSLLLTIGGPAAGIPVGAATPSPAATSAPTSTPKPAPTATSAPTATTAPTTAPTSTSAPTSAPTSTPAATLEPTSTSAPTSAATSTLTVTSTSSPTSTLAPLAPAVAGPIISIGDASVLEGNQGRTRLTFTVSLSSAGSQVTVDYATADGTATVADNDYVPASGTLHFNANQTVQTIDVSVNGDTLVEDDETFSVILSNPTGGAQLAADNVGTGTILDDDRSVTPAAGSLGVNITGGTATEGDVSNVNDVFTVALVSGPCNPCPVTFTYGTQPGTAIANVDYATATGTLSWATGDTTSRFITVAVLPDTLNEANETFTVSLTVGTNAKCNPASSCVATGTIVDNDAPPVVSIAPTSLSVTEGTNPNAVFTSSFR